MLIESDQAFAAPDEPVYQVFNGLPRSSLYSAYDFSLLWFKLFGIYYGFVINKILMSVVGFMGMFYLLKQHFLPKDSSILIPAVVALLFSLLPFWSFTMTVSGLPLALFGFLNIRMGSRSYVNWLIILLFPFYSSLILSGVFFGIIVGCLYVYDLINTKRLNIHFLLALMLFGCAYLISHFPVFHAFLISSKFVSHRTEFQLTNTDAIGAAVESIKMFVVGHYHSHTLHTLFFIPVIYALYQQFLKRQVNKRFIVLFLFILLTSILYGLRYWDVLAPLVKQMMEAFPLQIQRFHFLHPLVWYLMLGISLNEVVKRVRWGRQLVLLLLVFQLLNIARKHDLITQRDQPTFRRFYASELFEEVRSFIGRPNESYAVVSVGVHPGISQYNGFYTVDGYFPSYPLSYKHKFREIIAQELDKDEELKKYFDHWGSRCYAFSSELGLHTMDPNPKQIEHLAYNFQALKNLGAKYILSSAKINTSNNTALKLLKSFDHVNSYWRIHLYEIE